MISKRVCALLIGVPALIGLGFLDIWSESNAVHPVDAEINSVTLKDAPRLAILGGFRMPTRCPACLCEAWEVKGGFRIHDGRFNGGGEGLLVGYTFFDCGNPACQARFVVTYDGFDSFKFHRLEEPR